MKIKHKSILGRLIFSLLTVFGVTIASEEVYAAECLCKIEGRSRTVTLDYSLGKCSRLDGSTLSVDGTEVKVYSCTDKSGAKSK
jgi:hypothetical protein